ncbi:histidine phosphatase family protein [Isoalcanivorax beigongshangi]|uniref:Histidine phosphatase family protein n=1 Tax=Isoalcanivorax beigongshangi TaxID=3238810 RepID=A0ABV4ADA3_9GAMM
MILNATPYCPPTHVELLRHGEAVGPGVFRGQRDDPLSNLGWSQMRTAVTLEEHWDAVLTSPLQRCQSFAEQIAGINDIPLYLDADFSDLDFGHWTGLRLQDLPHRDQQRLQSFWSGNDHYAPPEGETRALFSERVVSAWQYWTERLQGQRILMICHGSVMRMVIAHVLGMDPSRMFLGMRVPHGSRSTIALSHTDHGTFSSLVAHGVMPKQVCAEAA